MLIIFEQQTYDVTEGPGGVSVEVCAVTSATPAPGQTISGLLSTADDTAIGMHLSCS